MKPITVGLVGSGYAAYLHGNGYKKVSGVPVRLKTVVDIDIEKAKKVAETFGFENAITDFNELLNDEEIDVIDLCTPPSLHPDMIIKTLKAGKHVMCEKPLTGYFGREGDLEPIGKKVSKKKMYEDVLADMDEIKKVVDASDKKFLYAENFVYCTNIQKAAEVLRNKKSKILFMKGEESLKGSSSPVAGRWDKTGGGSLIRVGCHPLSGMLWLKQVEAAARGEKITIKEIVADTGEITPGLTEYEKRHIGVRPYDVEDFATVNITFSDNTKALVIAADTVLGGTKNYVELYCNDNVMMCNITPTDILKTYFLDEDGLENVTIAEMLPSKLGWNNAFVSDEVIRGYVDELQDFMEALAYDREPQSTFDLAYESTKVIYAAYLSASEGRKVEL